MLLLAETAIEATALAQGKSEASDPVRALLVRLAQEQGRSLLSLSRAIGKNHAYFQQFVRVQVPRRLPPDVRRALGRLLGVDPRLFQPVEEREEPLVRLPGEPINPELMHEAQAIAERLVKGNSADQKFRRTETMGFVYTLLERQAAGIPFDLRDPEFLRMLEVLSRRLHNPSP